MQKREGGGEKKEEKIKKKKTKQFSILYRSYTHCFSGDANSLKQILCLCLISTEMLASHPLHVCNS